LNYGRYDRFFYHSFPRPRQGAGTDVMGVEILRLIAKFGFLMTPEMLRLDEVSGLAAAQTRLCLTEIHPSELPAHAKSFGPFSLEIDMDIGRKLGAMPVIYIPQPTEHGPSKHFDGFGFKTIQRLAEIQSLLEFMALLEAQSEDKSTGNWKVQRFKDSPVAEIGASQLRNLMLNLRDDASFSQLAATLRGLASLYYPVDNPYELAPQLQYYRQREWRIVSDLVGSSGHNSRKLDDAEAKEVAASNPAFFSKVIEWTDGFHPRLDLCRLLMFPKEAWPRIVKRILVPEHLVAEVEKMPEVAELDVPIVSAPIAPGR
jgi:hypothetical protein